jgi:hypothetical protein
MALQPFHGWPSAQQAACSRLLAIATKSIAQTDFDAALFCMKWQPVEDEKSSREVTPFFLFTSSLFHTLYFTGRRF